jgi:CMP-N-acetylneuraminic acid synthetase
MKAIALLPMKAHSSRVPGKNFKILQGKPLFRWILDELLALPIVTEVVINTDAEAELRSAGLTDGGQVTIRQRRPELCGDEVSMNRIIEDDLEAYPDTDHFLMTHTTNPLLSRETMERAWATYIKNLDKGMDSLFTVNRFQTRFYREDGAPVNHDPDNLIPTQDLEPWYEENSCLYIFSRQSFRKSNARIGARPSLFETPAFESVDIDEPKDWEMAEALIQHRFQSK